MGVVLSEERIQRLEGDNGQRARSVYANGMVLRRGAAFVRPEQRPRIEPAVSLGCDLSDDSPYFLGLIRVE